MTIELLAYLMLGLATVVSTGFAGMMFALHFQRRNEDGLRERAQARRAQFRHLDSGHKVGLPPAHLNEVAAEREFLVTRGDV